MESSARIREFDAEYKRLEREYPQNPKIVYLASCYRSARGEHGVDLHIAEASVVARKLWKLGLSVICPVKNTAFFGGCDIPDECWLLGDCAMIKRCDAIVMHENYETSAGARRELECAREAGIPAFFLMKDWRKVAAWAKGGKEVYV